MQALSPINTLLTALSNFAGDVSQLLTRPGIDWKSSKQGGEWSLTQVMCHLRDVEREVHQPRFTTMLRTEDPFLPGVVADKWVHERHYQSQDGPRALASFLIAREQTLAQLEELTEADWERRGQHAFFGPTTMHELLYLVVQHDEAHREQINKLLNQSLRGSASPASG